MHSYKSLFDPEIKKGDLNSNYDVIVFRTTPRPRSPAKLRLAVAAAAAAAVVANSVLEAVTTTSHRLSFAPDSARRA